MGDGRRPRRPTGLDGRGRRWWDRMLDAYEFSSVEVEVLVEAARTLSAVEALEKQVRNDGVTVEGARGGLQAHPALVEARLQRQAFGRLVAQLDLPDDEGVLSPQSARAKKAAEARWAQVRARKAAGGSA